MMIIFSTKTKEAKDKRIFIQWIQIIIFITWATARKNNLQKLERKRTYSEKIKMEISCCKQFSIKAILLKRKICQKQIHKCK